MINKDIYFKDLGESRDYKEIWDFQEEKLQQIVQQKFQMRDWERRLPDEPELQIKLNQASTPNYLYFVQHPHVYTIGKSGDENNLLANLQTLSKIKATYVKTNRGGDITYHGPGQLVVYPILDLANFQEDIHWYMRSLEEVVIRTIAHFEIHGERSEGETGVWLDVGKPYARKICAMGVKASRWVSMHGLALNVNTDLRYFEYIIPCGIKDKNVTSLQRELNRDVDIQEVGRVLLKHFAEVFSAEILMSEENQTLLESNNFL